LAAGTFEVSDAEAHHLRTVLRVKVGDSVSLFDGAGGEAAGRIARVGRREVVVEVAAGAVRWVGFEGRQVVVATAVPKGTRQRMLVEKCTELGTTG